jgi:hypothetical protein
VETDMMNYKELKSIFARVLLPLGYTAAKNMFFRRIGEVILIVDLQKSTFGGNYYVNIGLFVDEEVKLTQPPPFHKTHLKQTLTSIVPQVVRDKLVPALDLEVAMRADDRSDIITSAMVRYGLPFLTPLGSIEGIADFLDPQKRNFALVTLALRSIISRRTGRDDVLLPEQKIQRGGS